MNRDSGFFKPTHDKDNFTGTHRPAVSQWDYPSALVASAVLPYFGTLYLQSGRPPMLAGRIPGVNGFMGRSGVSGLAEPAYVWCRVRYGLSGEHIFLYGESEWSALLPTLMPSATAR